MAGFELAYTLHGGDAAKLDLAIKSGEAVVKGVLVKLDTGEAALGTTNATTFLGVCTGVNAAGTIATVVVDPDAVYRVTDATARVVGATLDIATGAAGVTTSSNVDVVVAGKSPAGAATLVKITSANHALVK